MSNDGGQMVTFCADCGWPTRAGHARTCRFVGTEVARFDHDADHVPGLVVPVFGGEATGGLYGITPTVVEYHAASGALVDHVALPLAAFRALLSRAHSLPPVEGDTDRRLRELERRVAEAADVARMTVSVVRRLVALAEHEAGRCLECDGTGTVPHDAGDGRRDGPAGDPVACSHCGGTGRAR
jgi:hypothetical protein